MDENILTLMEVIADGKEAAFKKLYDQYHQKIYALAYYLMQNKEIAQDITQDIFLKIWDKRRELKDVNNFDAWVKVVVQNHAYNLIAKAAREKTKLNDHAYHSPEDYFPEKYLELKEENTLLQLAINNLPPQQKRVYILSRHEGLKASEIAQILDISVHTVKNHLKVAVSSISSFCRRHIGLLVLLLFRS